MFKGFKNIGTQGIVGAFTDLTNVKKNFNEVTDEEIAGNEKQITAYEKFQNQLQTQIDLLEKEGDVVGNNASVASTAAKEKIDASREVEDAILANREDSEAKEQEMNMIAFQRFKEDTEKRVKNKEIEESEKVALIAAAEEKGRLKRIEIGEKYKAIDEQAVADAKIADEEKAALDLETLTARLDAESEVKKAALEKQTQDIIDAEQAKKDEFARGLEITQKGLEAAGQFADMLFAGQLKRAEGNEEAQDKIRRKAFKANKTVAISLAIMQGIQSVQGAFASANANIGATAGTFGAYPVTMASLAGVFAALNVAKIASTQFEGGSAGSITPPSGGGGASVPQFNVVGNSPQNQLAQSLGQGQDQPVQTFVVAGDVTTAQSLERNAIQTASL